MKKFFILILFFSSLSIIASAQEIIVKTIVFSGSKDSAFLKEQKLIKKVDAITFNKMKAEKNENQLYADTIVFAYKTLTWERKIKVILSSNIAKTPLFFSVAGVGTTWNSMIGNIRDNFGAIKEAMRKQELGLTKTPSII